VSDQIKPELQLYLEEQGVDSKVIDTTIRKMCFGQFADVPGKGKVVVVVFHCKSFKKLVTVQAGFVAHTLTRAAAVFGCDAFGVGDMNIEAKWPKGTSVAAQRDNVAAAAAGKLPALTVKDSALFGSTLADAGYVGCPEAGTITTLKMRSQFQGQPDKEGDLTCVHKDYVIVPASASAAIKAVVVGGRRPDGGGWGNMDLLMPSRAWPADHFAIFVVV
jgi:hypothetical protein